MCGMQHVRFSYMQSDVFEVATHTRAHAEAQGKRITQERSRASWIIGAIGCSADWSLAEAAFCSKSGHTVVS